MDRNSTKGLILLLFLVLINIVNARVIRSGPSDSLDFQTNGVNSRMEILSSGEVSAKTRFKMLDSMVFTPLTQVNRNGLTPEDGLAIWNTDNDELNIYDATGTVWRQIVDLDSAQEFTLKTINGDNNNIFNLEHGLEVDNPVSGVHGVVGNVVGTTDVQTLTNKTYDADSNSLSNVSDTNIKVGAAITRSKLANATANYVLINDGTGVISEEQFLAKTRGGTGITSTATFPASGTVSVIDATEDLSNKTFTDDITLTEIAAPATPAAGDKAFYCKTDDKCYFKNDAGVETEISTGGGVPATVSVQATDNGTQTITLNTNIQIDFDTEDHDTDAAFASNVFTVPTGKGGYYHFGYHLKITNGVSVNNHQIWMRVNSAGLYGLSAMTQLTDNKQYTYTGSFTKNLSAGDTVDLIAFSAGATSSTGSGGGTGNNFFIFKVQ